MTLEEAHKMLDDEYSKSEIARVGLRHGKVPNCARVAAALIKVTEKAKEESTFFYLRMCKEVDE